MAVYSDINIKLPDSRPLVEDVASVAQSISSILMTEYGERYFRPEIYTDLEDHIFDPIDDITAFEILTEIDRKISLHEPRVELNFGSSTVIPFPNEVKYEVKLVLKIKRLGDYYLSFGATLKKSM